MVNRVGGWLQIWLAMAVIWTIVAATSGWMNLPRARQVPHDPQFLAKLSDEATAILRGQAAHAKHSDGVLVWSEDPRLVRMSNGVQLAFPATTTNERAELVAIEYHQLLKAEADRQSGPYLLELLAFWLIPLLFAGIAVFLVAYIYRPAQRRTVFDPRHLPA